MNSVTCLLLFISLAILLLGGWLWRLTSSRSTLINTLFGTVCLMLAAYHCASRQQMEWAIMLPFFTTMLFVGRAAGTWWRSRKETDLLLPARLLAVVAGLAFTATVSAYVAY